MGQGDVAGAERAVGDAGALKAAGVGQMAVRGGEMVRVVMAGVRVAAETAEDSVAVARAVVRVAAKALE